jgi:lysophospholipase
MGAAGPKVSVEEGFHKTWDDTELFFRKWSNSGQRRGTVVLMHGYAEHSGRYHHVASVLTEAGLDVWAIDARGHGRSPGVRGHIDRFDVFVRDLESVVQQRRSDSQEPIFVLGHSHGGTIALRYAQMSPRDVSGFVVTSPFLGIAIDVPLVKRAAGEVMSRVWPTLAIPAGMDPSAVSRDPEVVEHYVADPMVFQSATARWYTEVTAVHERLVERAREIVSPCLFLVAGSDQIVDSAATQRLFERVASEDRKMEVYESAYHELLNEPEWRTYLSKIVDWIDERIDAERGDR